MRKKLVLLASITIPFVFICFLAWSTLLRPANPKLHKIRIGEERRLTDIYIYKCENVVFIEGEEKSDKIKLFCDSVKIRGFYETWDVLMLLIDKDRRAMAYPIYTYFDDLEREPFYDGIFFEVPFEKKFLAIVYL